MGYVPPRASELIREDLDPLLYQLFVTFGTGVAALATRHFPPPSSYERYLRELYGEPKHDWMPFLNNALLVCLITLVASIVYAVTT